MTLNIIMDDQGLNNMERILLVEDNRSLAKLLAKKITAVLPFEVDIAYELKEARLFMRQYSYFIALLDINLPDSPNGEVVDIVLEQHLPVIVLSGNTDKAFRKSMMEKDIIDYVGKGGIEDIDYILTTIDRLSKNREHKVMIVDDSMTFRKQMQRMVKNLFFQVYAVAHGEEALNMLEEHPDIRVVLTDYAMPVMDGLELTKEIRKSFSKDQLSILAISSSQDDETSARFLKNGATDFVKKPFSKEEFSCRLNNAVEALENIDALTNHADRDYLTGLYNRRYFFRSMPHYFSRAIEEGEPFAVVMVNIDDLQTTRDTYGEAIAEQVVIHLSELLRSNVKEGDMVAYFDDEAFCLLLKACPVPIAKQVLERLRSKTEASLLHTDRGEEITLTISIGAVLEHEDSLLESVDQADMMLYEARHKGFNQVVSS